MKTLYCTDGSEIFKINGSVIKSNIRSNIRIKTSDSICMLSPDYCVSDNLEELKEKAGMLIRSKLNVLDNRIDALEQECETLYEQLGELSTIKECDIKEEYK